MINEIIKLLSLRKLQENSKNEEEEELSALSIATIVAIIILIFYTVATPIFNKINFHYIHESGISMLLGVAFGLVAKFLLGVKKVEKTLRFDDEIFFSFVLPPIIFSAGYNLKKKAFFKYFFYTMVFGIFGTLVSFGAVALLIYYSSKLKLYTPFELNAKQILLFSSVIASTDSVAALCFIDDESKPKLFSILFGEGVLNDAICVVLYRIIKAFDFGESEFNTFTILGIITNFIFMFFMSTFMGITGGLLCSLFLKFMKKVKLGRTQEVSLILFFAFLTYTVTEIIGFSPILALLFCGIIMNHYAFYNLSFQAREESSIVSKIMSNIAEGFVFTYLGLTSTTVSRESFSITFIALVFFFCVIGRFLAVYGLSFFLTIIRCPSFNLSYNDQGIMFFAGCIRGAIAFGLAISIPEMGDPKGQKLLSFSTLVLVFFTTIIFGAFMSPIVKFFTPAENKDENKIAQSLTELEKFSIQGYDINFKKKDSKDNLEKFVSGDLNKENEENKAEENKDVIVSNENKKLGKKIEGFWTRIDNNYLRPFFIDDWPYVKEEHDLIASEIINVFEEIQKNKMKQKILRKLESTSDLGNEGYTPGSPSQLTQSESLLFKE